jgi:hypothetical protein
MVILPKGSLALGALQKIEGGEIRELQPLVEDEGCLDTSVGQEEIGPELGQHLRRPHFNPPARRSRGSFRWDVTFLVS